MLFDGVVVPVVSAGEQWQEFSSACARIATRKFSVCSFNAPSRQRVSVFSAVRPFWYTLQLVTGIDVGVTVGVAVVFVVGTIVATPVVVVGRPVVNVCDASVVLFGLVGVNSGGAEGQNWSNCKPRLTMLLL